MAASQEQLKTVYAEIQRHLKTSPDYKHMPPERAFIHWYIHARYGKHADATIHDGANDGGIDATICLPNGGHVVLQAKYGAAADIRKVPSKDIEAFQRLTMLFTHKEAEGQFRGWLGRVRPDHQRAYRALRKSALNDRESVRFVFLTSKHLILSEYDGVDIEDIGTLYALWALYREGFTPPAESISVTLEHTWHWRSKQIGVTTIVGMADIQDFLKLMEQDKNERLFAQNVRTDLRTVINREIRRTYEQEPDKFWLGNNGLYIVCKRATSHSDRYHLEYPSIINGSQTLHSVFRSNKRHPCKILVRILEMDVLERPKMLMEVIRRTNTQNPMKLTNLSAHDPQQLHVALFLDRYGIFYERREGEWRNEKRQLHDRYQVVTMKQVAQWLACTGRTPEFGKARSRVKELFEEKRYQELFDDFDQNFGSSHFKMLLRMVWAGLFVKAAIRALQRKIRPFAKMSQLVLTRFVFDAITAEPSLHVMLENLLMNRRGLRWLRVQPAITKSLAEVVKDLMAIQSRAQQKDEALNFSNFFKLDLPSASAYRRACTVPRARRLAKLLRTEFES